MNLHTTPIAGAYLITLNPHQDQRGFFARTWCADTFAKHGLNTTISQCNLSYTRQAGTIRGLHYQLPPHAEAKLIRCISGDIFDVCVDLRPDSPTYLQHYATTLSAENQHALYIPEGCAHGFQSLKDHTTITYQVSAAYAPEHERGLRYDDPSLKINWPQPVTDVSERDQQHPFLTTLTTQALKP